MSIGFDNEAKKKTEIIKSHKYFDIASSKEGGGG